MNSKKLRITKDSKPKYADLHMHTTSKFFFHFNEKWDKIVPFKQKYGQLVKRSNLNRYHQSHPGALRAANVDLAHMTLLAGERAGHQADFFLFRWALFFITGLKAKQSTRFYNAYKTYHQMFQAERSYLERIPMEIAEFSLVNNSDDLCNDQKTKILVSVEGLHCFIGKEKKGRGKSLADAFLDTPLNPFKPRKTFRKIADSYQDNYFNDQSDYQDQIIKNIEGLSRSGVKIFSIGASHFEFNYMLGQAWAVPIPQLLRKIDFFSALNVPKDKDGLSNKAIELFKKVNLAKQGHRILFDVKHASLKTRREYYKLHETFHKENNIDNPIPIICSHTGVSGYKTFEEAAKNMSRNGDWKENPERKFNRWPINICDEDILKIHDSGGIIGIMVDRRLLGHFQSKIGHLVLQNSHYYNDIKKKLKLQKVSLDPDYNISLYIHGVMFLENVFHVVKVVGKKEGWDTVCFGSDFDGNIKPIDCCPTYNHINDFREILLQLMNEYFSNEKDLENIRYRFTNKELLDKFFYSNLTNFTTRVVKDFW